MVRDAKVAAVLLLLAAGPLVGCSTGSSSDTSAGSSSAPQESSRTTAAADGPYQPTDDDRAAIRRLLDDRAQALEAGDEPAFLATVDRTDDDLVEDQRTLFGNLTQLPLASVDYLLDAGSGLPAADVDGEDPVFRPGVVERVRLDGIDKAPVGNVLEDTFVKRADGWLLGAETLAGDYAQGEEPQSWPWGGGVRLVAAREGDLLVLVDSDERGQVQALASAMAQDIRDDAAVLGMQPRYDVMVDATSSGSVHMMNTLDDAEAAAVTFPVYALDRDQDATRFAGLRIKINPERVDELATDRHVLRHELTHFLTSRRLGAWPAWLSEGLAEYVADQPDGLAGSPFRYDAPALADVPRGLPTTAKWGLARTDYLIASAAVTALVDDHGVAGVLELGRAYEKAYDGGDADQLTAKVLPRTLGLTEADLVRETWDLLDALS